MKPFSFVVLPNKYANSKIQYNHYYMEWHSSFERISGNGFASEYANFEIIVADNHSDDETVAWVREYAPEVKVVELDRNYGYAGGNNRAAAAATGDILLFLNNDVAVTKNWLAPLSDTLDRKST